MSPRNEPFSLLGWIAEHAADFAPPVANKVVWSNSDFIFMIIRGPNARNDFHVDPGDEIFYQLRGDIRVDLMIEGGDGGEALHRVTRLVREGEVMLVPGGTPHAPMRPADTWGLVIERPRAPDELDALRWYCESCGAIVHEHRFHVADIETELKTAIDGFNADEARRTCAACGDVVAVAGEFRG